MDLFTLSAKLGLDTSEYEKKVGDAIGKAEELKTALGDTGDAASDASGSIGDASGQVSIFGETVGAILTADAFKRGAKALADFAGDAIDAASALNEVQNVVDVTYGDMSGRLDSWAKTTKNDYGLTELQSKQYAGYLGQQIKTAGLSMDDTFDMATSLTELAGDIASFYDIDFETAFGKIQSGMSGQVKPLRDFGIDLSVKNLEAYAKEQGIETAWKSMSQAEQYMLRYQYLMEQTADIQGDFMRTSDQFANARRTFDNNVTEWKASVGQALLPFAQSGYNFANSLFDSLLSSSTEDSLAAIDSAATDTAAGIESTARQAEAMIGVLEGLGDRSELTAQQQGQWDSVVGQLIRSIPELDGLINRQTGEIDGGTQALRENVSAWEEAGKAAADTSALEAKQDMLDRISGQIEAENTQIAIAKQAIDDASGSVLAFGQAIASETGQAFDGTLQGVRDLVFSVQGWDAAVNKFGLTPEQITGMFMPLDEATAALDTHQESLSGLQTEYDTVSAAISEASSGMTDTVQAMEEDIGASFDGIMDDTDALVSNFNQSGAASSNAYSTGMSAAQGLEDAYPSYAAAASKYSMPVGGGTPSLPGSVGDTSSSAGGESGFGHAKGLWEVPYDDYPALLHRDEMVLTASRARDYREGNAGGVDMASLKAAITEAIRAGMQGVAVNSYLNGQSITDDVNRNTVRQLKARRFAT